MADLLLVDDDALVAGTIARYLEGAGHAVRLTTTGAAALAAWRARRPDVTLLNVRLPDMSGFDVFAHLREERPVVIMTCGDADIPLAVRAVQEGVETFLTTPVQRAQLCAVLDRAVDTARRRQLARYRTDRRVADGRAMIGRSAAMRELAAQVELLAGNDRATVLLQGEHGTGKGRVARWMHACSPRAHGPFVEVACAARSAAELERELFGTEDPVRGERHVGALQAAAGGTLLLDGIGDVPIALQPTLLRLLQERTFRPVGGVHDIAADVRIIAASGGDLASAVHAGRLREELYYCLSVMPITLPPLRSRAREDLVDLIAQLIDELAPHLPAPPRAVDGATLDALVHFPWPGNIRELRSVLERGMIVGRGASRLEARFLPPDVFGVERVDPEPGRQRGQEPRTLHEVERAHIEQTLRRHEGNRTHASRALGIARATLIKKIKAFDLSVEAG